MTNELKIEGTIVSKVNKSELQSGLKIASFILKSDGERPVYIPVKFVGRKPIELEKNQHVWVRGSLINVKKQDGTFELGLNAVVYKIHDQVQEAPKPNVSKLDEIQVDETPEDEPVCGFKGVKSTRRRQ